MRKGARRGVAGVGRAAAHQRLPLALILSPHYRCGYGKANGFDGRGGDRCGRPRRARRPGRRAEAIPRDRRTAGHRAYDRRRSWRIRRRPDRRRHPSDDSALTGAGRRPAERVTAVNGGATRQESTRLGLARPAAAERPDVVLIHDARAPFVDAELMTGSSPPSASGRRLMPAMPVADTLKTPRRRRGRGTVSRMASRRADPPGLPFRAICAAHEGRIAAGRHDFTDDAAIAEWAAYAGEDRRGLARQCQAHLGKGYRHGRPAAFRRHGAFPTCAPATAMTCTPSSRATT